jgi:hypothetical protein
MFIATNGKPLWWNTNTVSAYVKNPDAEEIDFNGIFKLHALSITSMGKKIKIEAWWEEIRHEEVNSQRMLFLHLVDSSGNILYNNQIILSPYTPFDDKRRWRYGEATFEIQASDERVMSLAFGINNPHEAGGGFLLANKGGTDWNEKRVIIPIKLFLAPPVATSNPEGR